MCVCATDVACKYSLSEDKVNQCVAIAKKASTPETKVITVSESGCEHRFLVTRCGIGPLVKEKGTVWQFDFRIDDSWNKYSVLVSADIDLETFMPHFHTDKEIILRIDSGCETGQVFGDRTCDCAEQLHIALDEIIENQGIVINIPHQDGRGLGLPYKLSTLYLQHVLGINTVESASLLSGDGVIDKRSYAGVVALLKFLGISTRARLNFLTNNPFKRSVFQENGYQLQKNTNVHVEPTEFTKHHFEAKKVHLGHEFL